MDKDIASESKSGNSESLSILDDSILPNGCILRHPIPVELADDCERVGVLDYMPLSRHPPPEASQKNAPVALHRLRTTDTRNSVESFDRIAPDEPRNIELTTFRITECRDRRNLAPCSSCASDDDELLGAEADDYLHEVVVESSDTISGIGRESPGDREGASLVRCIPSSSFGATRDGAWSRPDTGCESPPVDNEESGGCQDLEEDTFTTFRVSSYKGGCVATTTMDERDDEALEDRSLHHDSSTSIAEDEKDPEVQTGSSSLPPVEVVSVDRSPMDPGSISRSNVLYLNDYSLWTNAARAFCRDESASDRSEVEKRQERRDKRRERRGHERTVKAEEIEGYMGMNEVMDLVEYIQGEVEKSREGALPAGKKETAKRKSKESETSATSLPGEMSKSAEMPRKNLTQKQKSVSKTLQKTTSLKLPEKEDAEEGEEVLVGTAMVSIERSRSENAEEDSMPEQPNEEESSTLLEMSSGLTELDPIENPLSAAKDLGRASTRSNSPDPEESTDQSTEAAVKFCSTTVDWQKSASKTDEPEQMPGPRSKKSKKQNNKKNRSAQVADKAQRVSQANYEITSETSQSLSSPQPSQDDAPTKTFPRAPESGTLVVDGTNVTLSESELSADVSREDMSYLYRYPYNSSSAQDKVQDMDDEWTVHTRRHPKNRPKPGDGENRSSIQGEQHPIAWKDQSGKPAPGYRQPEGRGPFGRVGSIGDGYQGQKFPLGGRGRQGSMSSLNLETSNKVGSRTFWGSRDSKEYPKVSDAPRNSTKFPNPRSCADDVEIRKEESVTYARITAGEPVWPRCQSNELVCVEKATPGLASSKPDGANEAPSQIGEEVDLPQERVSDDTNVNIEPDGTGRTGGDLPSKASSETDLELAPKEQPRSGITTVSMTTKQVSNDTTLSDGLASSSKNLSRTVGNVSSSSTQEDHSRVQDHSSSDASTIEVDINITEMENKSTADVTEIKPGVLSIDKDAASQNLPKTHSPIPQQKRNPETKTKTLPVEFSKRFKGAKVDGISFCFDPTVADSKSQGLSSYPDRASSTLDSPNSEGGTISNRLVSGPTYSTTVVPAGGGLQSQSSGTSVSNCSRPIAPLSGSGHASGAKTPVVVVNPMQLVARGPAEPSQMIVGNDMDREIRKEVMVATGAVQIDDGAIVTTTPARIVMATSSPVFPSKMEDIAAATPADSTRPTQLNESPLTTEGQALAKRVTFVEEPQHGAGSVSRTEIPLTHQGDTRAKHLDPVSPRLPRDVQLETPQEFVPPSVYVLYQPCVMYPQQPLPGIYRQGTVSPVGSPLPEAAPLPPQGLYQPRSRQEQHAVRPQVNCAMPSSLPPRVVVPVASLVFIQNYIHNEFQKVLEEEKHDSARVVRFKAD